MCEVEMFGYRGELESTPKHGSLGPTTMTRAPCHLVILKLTLHDFRDRSVRRCVQPSWCPKHECCCHPIRTE